MQVGMYVSAHNIRGKFGQLRVIPTRYASVLERKQHMRITHIYVLYVIWRRKKKNEWVQLWDNARAGVQAIMQVHSVHTAEPSRQTRV